jgi:pyruvate dehydrogenase E2 component (dihydrolipoamide acetyltransferase)
VATAAAAAPSGAQDVFSPAGLSPSRDKLPFFLPDPDRVRATPRARRMAAERGIDLSEIAGSGPEGAVLVGDIARYLEALEAEAEPSLPGDVPVTPVAQRIADELGIDVSRVKGTGPGGRVTKRDLRAHVERSAREGTARDLELFGDEIKLSQKRKFLIRNMVESKRTAPHFYISMEVDAEPLGALRDRLKAEGKRITYTHMIVKACALALEHMPEVNATFREDRILRFNPINIAVAVDVQDELVAPVVKNCQGQDLESLAASMDALIARARERKLSPDDYSDGTFTVSNLGMFGVDRFYAILTPPQSMVLSVGALRKEPIVDGDRLRPGLRVNFGLGVDHRVLDGVRAAQFLAEVKRRVEDPSSLLVRSTAHGD